MSRYVGPDIVYGSLEDVRYHCEDQAQRREATNVWLEAFHIRKPRTRDERAEAVRYADLAETAFWESLGVRLGDAS
jgi:hypothetical protein